MHSSAPLQTSGALGEAPLKIVNVVKTFGANHALDHVSLELQSSECLGLLGPNGAGKTTLVRTIVGRVIPDSGDISVLGERAGSAAARTRIGYVPQELAIYPLLSSRENLRAFGNYLGLSGRALREAIEWCLEWAALRDRANDPVKTFSGGMKRRLNMAAGLINRAPIVLLDEPTVGVDPQSRERIYEMIEQLRADGTSIIYTSHYMEEVERLCDRVAIIDAGRIIAEGSPADLVRTTFGNQAELTVHFVDGAAASNSAVETWLSQFAGKRSGDAVRFPVSDAVKDIPDLLRAAASYGISVRDLSLQSPNLQAVFLKLTGKDLRE